MKRAVRMFSTGALLAAAAAARAQDVTPQAVRRSIDAATAWLLERQRADGSWGYEDPRFVSGADALATLALLKAGVPAADPRVQAAVRRIAQSPNDYTYNVALKIAALAAADPLRHRAAIHQAAQRLAGTQIADGSWSYSGRDIRAALSRGDNSNTQFALLGLHEAARIGVRVESKVWRRAADHWRGCQNADGSWGYLTRGRRGHGSMTAAGVASLIICGNEVVQSVERRYENGAAERCGQYATDPQLAAGLEWIGKNLDVARNPGVESWHHYWLYALERAGMLTGLKYFGPHDWYREGAAHLVSRQHRDGSWNARIDDTAFALLFLAKGRRPLLINKLQWSDDSRWNPDRHDCEHLVAFIGDRLGEPLAWQSVPLSAPLSEWLAAPILYIQGHEFPSLAGDDVARLQGYVQAGGTILAEACCSRERFTTGLRGFIRQAFPERSLAALSGEHPVWSALFPIERGAFSLEGLDVSCRTGVFFLPTDVSCLWEQARPDDLSQRAFQLGANIAAYVTGREPLRERLEVVRIPADSPPPRAARQAAARGLQMVQLVHNGDWNSDPQALPNLTEFLREAAGVDVVAPATPLRPDDPRLFDYAVAYMTGHYSFHFSPAETAALRTWLRRGGFLLADACCGRRPFDVSFREAAAELFPDQPLRRLPADHAIIRGGGGFDLSRVRYHEAVLDETPGLTEVRVDGIALEGRLAVIYSPYGLACGLEGHACFACRGLARDDARKLAANIVLHALSP